MRKESMVCPKPRRLGRLNVSTMNDHIRPLRRPIFNYQSDMEDPSGVVRAELLDIILPKESCPDRSGSQVGCSPPYFCGSPPSRASNPVIQDEQFGNGNCNPFAIMPPSPSSSSSARGCVQASFGHKPAAVRIEGFDCLSRDRVEDKSNVVGCLNGRYMADNGIVMIYQVLLFVGSFGPLKTYLAKLLLT